MEGHAGDTGKCVLGPHPQGYIFDSDSNVTMRVLPREPILGEATAWDMDHTLEVTSFEADEGRWAAVATKSSFNKPDVQVRLNEWKYINNLIDVRDGASSPSMQDITWHSTSATTFGLAIGNRMLILAQTAR